jgi:hypothetical protein
MRQILSHMCPVIEAGNNLIVKTHITVLCSRAAASLRIDAITFPQARAPETRLEKSARERNQKGAEGIVNLPYSRKTR